MEETNGVGITADKTNIDRGQGSSESMMRLSLIFSSLGLSWFACCPLSASWRHVCRSCRAFAARSVRFNIIPAGAVE